jgi:hypothetical protein
MLATKSRYDPGTATYRLQKRSEHYRHELIDLLDREWALHMNLSVISSNVMEFNM